MRLFSFVTGVAMFAATFAAMPIQAQAPGAVSTTGATFERALVDSQGNVRVPAVGMTPLGYSAAMRILTDSFRGMHPAVGGHLVMRRDSVRAVVDSMARTWSTAVALNRTPHLIERLPLAHLYAHGGDLANVQRQIDALLAAPGLSLADRVWVLEHAVNQLFGADDSWIIFPPPSPGQLALAKHYLVPLEAVPLAASGRSLFSAYMTAMYVYAEIGAVDTAIMYGFRAMALPAKTPDYAVRFDMAVNTGVLGDLALLLSADGAHYQQTLDSLVAVNRPYMMERIPAASAKVPGYPEYVAYKRQTFEADLEELRRIGRPAPPLIATHWFNQPQPTTVSDAAPNARVLKQGDGIIRVLGFGFFACPYCKICMGEWEKFQHELPAGVQLLFYERAVGSWGADLVEPDVEAEHYRHYFVDRKHYTYPIAIWAGPKEKNEEGGMVPKYSPTMGLYGFLGGPHIVVVDGHGILRYRGRWDKQNVLRIVQRLTHEQQRSVRGTASSAPPSPAAPSPRASSSTPTASPTASLAATAPSAVALTLTLLASPARLHPNQ